MAEDDSLFLNSLVNETSLGDDFDMFLPPIDGSEFLAEEDDALQFRYAVEWSDMPQENSAGQPAGSACANQSQVSQVGAAGSQVGEGASQVVAEASQVGAEASQVGAGESQVGEEKGAEDDEEDEEEDEEDDDEDDGSEESGSQKGKKKKVKVKSEGGKNGAKPRGNKTGITTKGANTEAEKKAKRREQIAAASRASRARRKQELQELREENQKLRDERSKFLTKISELQVKVENMRERGSPDMRVENALLRAQLEEHKRFISHFKHLCDGAPSLSIGTRHVIYKQGSDSAQTQILSLISQSMADNWISGRVPNAANIPFQNFHFCYKFKSDYGEKSGQAAPRQRLNVRVDLTFPGFQSSSVSDFLWNSFSSIDVQQRLYKVSNIELTQLADDMPDKDTKMVYYREKLEAPKKDQDWVVLCNRQLKQIARSTLLIPPCHGEVDPCTMERSSFVGNFLTGFLGGNSASASQDSSGPPTKRVRRDLGKVNALVLAMSTTQHSVAQFENANRITSMFIQGAVTWDEGGDARVIIVFSFPDDFKIKAMEGFKDVINVEDGTMSSKFASVIKEFNELLGEQGEDPL